MFMKEDKCPSCGQMIYKRLKDVDNTIHTGAEQIQKFIDSALYGDYKNELEIRLYEFDQLLDDPLLEYTGRHYDLFRGAKYALQQSLELFERLLSNKQHDEEIEQGEK
jgi:hypothetical protein